VANDLHGLKVDARQDGPLGLVRIRGDVRFDQIHAFTSAVDDLAKAGTRHLVLDLAGLSFIDSASIGVIVRTDSEVAKRGGRMVVHSVPRVARKVLEVTGLDKRIAVAKDETDARKTLGAT
jgi:anti-anti-sigma factor